MEQKMISPLTTANLEKEISKKIEECYQILGGKHINASIESLEGYRFVKGRLYAYEQILGMLGKDITLVIGTRGGERQE